MKILYNFPSRSRPGRLINTLQNIQGMSDSDNYCCILKLDSDDKESNNPGFLENIKQFPWVTVALGESRSKVHAVNRDIPTDGFEILVTISDDMLMAQKGFDNIIREGYADGFKGAYHICDQYAAERVITLPITHIDYYLKDKYVYNPNYSSVYGDNEMHEVAILRGEYKLCPLKGVIIHMHPSAGFGEPDALLQKTDSPKMYAQDGRMYRYRKSINFGL